MPRVFISTAETSAERHASHVAKALIRRNPGMIVDAAGGAILTDAGADILVDMSGRAVMGFWEAIKQIGFYRQAVKRVIGAVESGGYDALVLVDAPSFHLPIAKALRRKRPDLPILYYIAPKLWAWKEWRIKNLRRDIDMTFCIFPFEVDFFHKRGVDAVYVGNPTLDQLRDVTGGNMTRILRVEDVNRHNEPQRGVLAVFPGSRKSEIRYIWPRMAAAIAMLKQRFHDLKVAVALAPGFEPARLERHAPIPAGVECVHGDSQELLAAASVVLAKSGTTTLEAALLGKPMVVVFASDPLSYFIASKVVKLPYVSLPNILTGRTIVRELLQSDATPEKMTEEITRLLTDAKYYRKMRSKLRILRQTLGDEFAAERAEMEIEKFIDRDDAS